DRFTHSKIKRESQTIKKPPQPVGWEASLMPDLRLCRLAEALPSRRIPPPIGRKRPEAIGARQAEEGHQDGATLPPFSLTRKHMVRITEVGSLLPNIHMKIRTAAAA